MNTQVRAYYDGLPQWILDMSLDEIEEALKAEEKKLKELNKDIIED